MLSLGHLVVPQDLLIASPVLEVVVEVGLRADNLDVEVIALPLFLAIRQLEPTVVQNYIRGKVELLLEVFEAL